MNTSAEKIAGQLISQVIRAILIGTVPFLFLVAVGDKVIYWHFLIAAYLVDTIAGLVNSFFKRLGAKLQAQKLRDVKEGRP